MMVIVFPSSEVSTVISPTKFQINSRADVDPSIDRIRD